MKNFIIAICITVITLITLITYELLLSKFFNSMYNQCSNVLEELDYNSNSNDIKLQISTITDKWDNSKKMLYYVCNHQLIEEIDKTILSLHLHIDENNKQSIYDDISFLSFYLNKFIQNERFSITNIFWLHQSILTIVRASSRLSL